MPFARGRVDPEGCHTAQNWPLSSVVAVTLIQLIEVNDVRQMGRNKSPFMCGRAPGAFGVCNQA